MQARSSRPSQHGFSATGTRDWGGWFWSNGYFSATNSAVTDDGVIKYF